MKPLKALWEMGFRSSCGPSHVAIYMYGIYGRMRNRCIELRNTIFMFIKNYCILFPFVFIIWDTIVNPLYAVIILLLLCLLKISCNNVLSINCMDPVIHWIEKLPSYSYLSRFAIKSDKRWTVSIVHNSDCISSKFPLNIVNMPRQCYTLSSQCNNNCEGIQDITAWGYEHIAGSLICNKVGLGVLFTD